MKTRYHMAYTEIFSCRKCRQVRITGLRTQESLHLARMRDHPREHEITRANISCPRGRTYTLRSGNVINISCFIFVVASVMVFAYWI